MAKVSSNKSLALYIEITSRSTKVSHTPLKHRSFATCQRQPGGLLQLWQCQLWSFRSVLQVCWSLEQVCWSKNKRSPFQCSLRPRTKKGRTDGDSSYAMLSYARTAAALL